MKFTPAGKASSFYLLPRIVSTVVLLVLVSGPCWGQWAATYPGVDGVDAEFIQQTSDGGYVVIAESNLVAGGEDFWVFKLDASARIQWQKLYGGSGMEDAQPIQQTSDGGYVAAGQTTSFGDPNGDLWVIKLFPNGGIDWQKTYGGAGEDEAADARQTDDDGDGTADDGYIVAGFTSMLDSDGDLWVLKLDASGDIVWQKAYGGDQREEAFSIQQTADRGYIVAGGTSSFGTAVTSSAWILKLKPDDAAGGPGQIEWQKVYTGDSREYSILSIQQTDDDGDGSADDGYIATGYIDSSGANYKLWVLKLNGDGSIAWQKLYGAGPRDFGTSIRQTDDDGDGSADDGYIVAGATGTVDGDFWVLKLFPDGRVDWQNSYGGSGLERRAEAIEQTMDGGFVTAGTTESYSPGGEVLVLKLRQDGSMDPSCDLVKPTDAPVVAGDARADVTDVEETATGITPGDSDDVPQDTDVSRNLLCSPMEDCSNGIDDDLDGRADCGDPDCGRNPACLLPAPSLTPVGWIAMVLVLTLIFMRGLRRRTQH
jgi:hypothetical protein